MNPNQRLLIVDFGLCNMIPNSNLLFSECGSPCYAAPEMILGKAYDGRKTDAWSCGIILFAMLCGFLPFENEDVSVLYKKITKGEYNIPNNLSRDAKDLIKQILNINP